MSGYSGTPLAQKLGVRAGSRVHARGAPRNYRELLAPLPPGVRFVRRADASDDILHLFVRTRAALQAELAAVRRALRDDAALWISWPKKSAGLASDLSEDGVRAIALPLGLVDIKVCAIDATWSALKFVVPRTQRASARLARRAPRV